MGFKGYIVFLFWCFFRWGAWSWRKFALSASLLLCLRVIDEIRATRPLIQCRFEAVERPSSAGWRSILTAGGSHTVVNPGFTLGSIEDLPPKNSKEATCWFLANGTWLVAVHEMVEYHLLDVIVSVFTRAWTLVRNARNARRGAVLTFNLWCGWSPSEK